jgi:signal transduction histidine kinase
MQQDEIQNNKLLILGKLAAGLVHEIRNPLSAIKLNLEYVRMSEVSEDVKTCIEAGIEASERIQTLIETTLDFSRASAAENYPESLNTVAENAASIMLAKANVLNIKIEKYLDPALPFINFNKNKILQVLINLVTNAIEAIGKGGTVKIKTYIEELKGENFVTIEVEDNGSGINEESKEKIFKDFYTEKINGTGLGLGVCRMILEQYNASMSFDTEPGKGTRFYVRFIKPFEGKKNAV